MDLLEYQGKQLFARHGVPVPAGKPAVIIDAWLDGKFTLLPCATHVDEPCSTLQKPVAGRRA